MKKSLTVVLSVALVSSMFASMAFADDAATTTTTTTTSATTTLDAQGMYDALVAKGIFDKDGTGTGSNLSALTTRAQIAKIIAMTFGLKEDAASSNVYKDLDGAGWAAGFIGAVTKAGYMDGVATGSFDPSSNVTLQQLATILARAFKLDTTSTDVGTSKVDVWAKGYVAAALKAGLISANADFTTAAKRSDLATSAYAAYTKASTPTTPATTSLTITAAMPWNSKNVAITASAAVATIDPTAITIKDSTGAVVPIASVTYAPYQANKTVLMVTTTSDMTVGAVYTASAGTSSVNFSGRAADTTKPTITSVTNDPTITTDVLVTFSEPIDITSATFTAAQKYGSQTALAIKSATYYNGTNNVIRLVPDTVQAGMLYGLTVTGAKDLAGNTMDTDTAQTFGGVAASTNKETIASAVPNNSKQIVVTLGENVDPASLTAANFSVKEAYGTQTPIDIDTVKFATTSDWNPTKAAAFVALDVSPSTQKSVIITLKSDMKNNTLYNVTMNNVNTIYGQGTDTTLNTINFAPSWAPLTVTGLPAALNNTSVVVTFSNRVDTTTATNIGNYTITDAYGNQTPLPVTAAATVINAYNIKLTVGAMSNTLYKLTMNGIKDVYGQTISTDNNANIVSFGGSAVLPKIASVSARTPASANSGTNITVRLDFDQIPGNSLTDVSHYTIDGGVGSPLKAARVDAFNNAKSVTLTLPNLNNGQVYTVTVKGLENMDGVAMDAAGVSATFVGSGNTTTAPQITGVVTLDKQTLEVYFDRSAKDAKLDSTDTANTTTVWNDSTHRLTSGILSAQDKNGAEILNLGTSYAYQDPNNANGLIIRTASTTTFSNNIPTSNLFTLNGASALFDANHKSAQFAPSTVDASPVIVTGVQSLNNSTVRVYYNQPVDVTGSAAKLTVYPNFDLTTKLGSGTPVITLANATKADSSGTVVDYSTSSNMSASTYYLVMNGTGVTDVSGSVNSKNENTTGTYQYRQFAGNSTAAGFITSVPVTMTDSRTIVVWFPEAMDAASAANSVNYSVYNAATAGTTVSFPVTNASLATDGTNKVTLTLGGDLGSSTTGYFLRIDNAVKNATQTKSVQTSSTDATALRSQFAINTTVPAKVTVTGATYYNAALGVIPAGTIAIKLSNKAAIGGATLYSNAGGADVAGNVTQFLRDFNLYLNGSATAAVASNISKVTTNAGAGSTFDTIYVTIAPSVTLDGTKTGKIQATGLTGNTGYSALNGMQLDSTNSLTFAQTQQ